MVIQANSGDDKFLVNDSLEVGEGNGPVDALAMALKRALDQLHTWGSSTQQCGVLLGPTTFQYRFAFLVTIASSNLLFLAFIELL
jgi:hypothetical protein